MTAAHRPQPSLDRGDLAVWLLTPPRQAPPAWDEPDPAERRRADAFRLRGDRTLYAAAHIALRRLLVGYLRTPARKLALARADCPEAVLAGGRVPGTDRLRLAGVRHVPDADHALDDLDGREAPDAREEELL
ncbi:hypothetical protein [Streptomyces sp. IBSBF 2806]|uniref:hypothetical protein n=1 Tax=Streptomyces sp. IBSBF 2806 TaxID=2903529 RepID=UPI002FDC1617